jgi:hypothetical protein
MGARNPPHRRPPRTRRPRDGGAQRTPLTGLAGGIPWPLRQPVRRAVHDRLPG